ncbi:AAA-like domain-containing protein [Leptolyngbya sp. AN02str]|uniref:AAA-like domain-containing protein n=1 Tax=Leptolyngbya sp. AN02str TaxID=3423363 RepID=UPI003D31CB96
MNHTSSGDQYQVGGCLPSDAPTYVVRQADLELYRSIKDRKFCTVLNSRQMGKSSLRVRVSESLRSEGYTCIVMDVLELCVAGMTEEDFYGAFVYSLISSCELSVDSDWWYTRSHIPIKLRLIRFIENVLLQQIPNSIVIFIDEVDHLLNHKFKDDFFILIRSLFNKRADYSQYNRLTFVLLGVATPSDLISATSKRTPFNIELQEIELAGFQLDQLEPLERGLAGRVCNPKAVLREIIDRTGGQPFLTQWLCELILMYPLELEEGSEAEWVEGIVRLRMIENWKINDRQEHFRTIANRLRSNDQYAICLLDIYKQILKNGEVEADDSYEQMQLQLTGLVVKRSGKLKVYNRIYKSIFDQSWIENSLFSVRPYNSQLTDWLASNCQDESKLLQGEALRDTLAWADKRSLGTQDYQFLTASQALNLEAESESFSKQREHLLWILIFLIIGSVLGAALTLVTGSAAYRSQARVQAAFELEGQAANALQRFYTGGQEIESLYDAIKVGQDLQLMAPNASSSDYPATGPIKALEEILKNIREVNQFKISGGWSNGVFDAEGRYFATTDGHHVVSIRNLAGVQVSELPHLHVLALAFSSDGRMIATASVDGLVKMWDSLSSKQIGEFKQDHAVTNLVFSPDGKSLAVSSQNGKVVIWDFSSQKFVSFSNFNEQIVGITFSQDGEHLITTGKLGTIRTWDMTGRLISEWQTSQTLDLPRSVSLSPNGKYLALPGSENSVQIISPSGHLVTQLKIFWSDTSFMNFSANSQELITVGDGMIRLWRISGQKIAEFRGPQGAVRNLHFNSATKTLVTAEWDGTVRVWNLSRSFERSTVDTQVEAYISLDELLDNGCLWLKDYFVTHPDSLQNLQVCKGAK